MTKGEYGKGYYGKLLDLLFSSSLLRLVVSASVYLKLNKLLKANILAMKNLCKSFILNNRNKQSNFITTMRVHFHMMINYKNIFITLSQ